MAFIKTNSSDQRGSIFKTNTKHEKSSGFGGRELLKMGEMMWRKNRVENVTHYKEFIVFH